MLEVLVRKGYAWKLLVRIALVHAASTQFNYSWTGLSK